MDPEDKLKTAFATSRHGLYHFKVMPFGLCNAPSTFERLMENVLAGLQFEILLIYLDDVIIPCKDFQDGIERLETVFQRFRKAELKLKAKKCTLFQKEVIYLGHKVSENGIETDPAKVEAVRDWPVPKDTHEVRSFMGLCSYYRRFVKDFAKLAVPLHNLTKKNSKFDWTEECQKSFEMLKEKLTTTVCLSYPSLDNTFILDTDASYNTIGCVLSQCIDGEERVIAYGSKVLLKAERNYCVTRKELLAIVYFVKQYKHYLYGKKFLLRTDHGALRWLFQFKDPEGQVARWLETLAIFDFDIQHRPGRQHQNADSLSRIPCKQCGMGGSEQAEVLVLTNSSNCEGSKSNHDDEPRFSASWLKIWDHDSLRQKQLDDPVIGSILRLKEKSDNKPTWQEVAIEDKSLKAYWAVWELLNIKNGVLYQKHYNDITKDEHHLLVVPKSLREQILHELHGALTGGHLGSIKTTGKVASWYYWLNWREDVAKYIAKCPECPRKKLPQRKNRNSLQQCLAGEPLQRVGMDILGPLPCTYAGNRYILVVVDYFTK